MASTNIELPTLNLSIPTDRGSSFMDPIEDGFSMVGLTTPMSRLVGTTLGIGAILYIVQPGIYFRNGHARSWSAWSNDPDAMLIPWWLAAILIGIVSATFI
jgi:hypothetical protein